MRAYFVLSIFLVLILTFAEMLSAGEILVGQAVDSYNTNKPNYVPDEIIVKFKPGASQKEIDFLNSKYGVLVIQDNPITGAKLFKIPAKRTVPTLVNRYNRSSIVEHVEPNFTACALFTPNDKYYKYQWHLKNVATGGMDMEKAWDVATGKGVIVAILDTGVAYEDYSGYKQAPDLSQTKFVQGYDFVNDDSHPNDDEGHGTHITGTIAQSTNNGVGVAGIAFDAAIMPVKVLDRNGDGNHYRIANGIYYAVNHGAKIINLSLGSNQSSWTLKQAVTHAYNNGVTIVSAAGNDYEEGNRFVYPAAYDNYCISVAATRYDGLRASYSNTGSYVDIAAPGGDVRFDRDSDGYRDGILQQTFADDVTKFRYYFFEGSSMAAAHVTGVVALLASNGISEPSQICEALESTARDMGKRGWDLEYGWGIVNGYVALNYKQEKPEPIVYDVSVDSVNAPEQAYKSDTVAINVTVANNSSSAKSAGLVVTSTVTLTNLTTKDKIGEQEVTLESGKSTTLTFQWDTSDVPTGTHTLIAEISKIPGEKQTQDNSTTVKIKIVEKPDRNFHVEEIDLVLIQRWWGVEAKATISIMDSASNPVSGAFITGKWIGVLNKTTFGVTEQDGKAIFYSGILRGNGVLTFRVVDVWQKGWIYDVDANKQGRSVKPDVLREENYRYILGQNYPNPFNPETWIPYEVAEASEVVIKIYDLKGQLVRKLNLGLQQPGMYLSKQEAAYWDGKDELGQPVASGMYFYTIKAGKFKATRKMLVGK